MKNLQTTALFFAMMLLLIACHGSKKATTSTTNEPVTFWLNSTFHEDIVIHDPVGVMSFGNCYSVSDVPKLEKDPFGFIQTKWEPLCGHVDNFDYEQGYIYRLVMVKTKSDHSIEEYGVDLSEWKVTEILSKQRDIHFVKREEITVWIGPKKIEARCGSPMTPPECRELRHQAQFGDLDKNGTWEPLYDIYTLPDYEEGYYYQVRYTKIWLSDFESKQIADDSGFRTEGLEVISKIKNW